MKYFSTFLVIISMNDNLSAYNTTEQSGNDSTKAQVLEIIMRTSMTTGMWKQLLRELVNERPDTLEWLLHHLSAQVPQTSDTPTPPQSESTMMLGIEAPSPIAQESDDPLHEELMARLDAVNEDDLLSCQSNALWVFRLTMQMGSLERALRAAEMDRSVFLRNITSALGYDDSDHFRIYNYLRRYDR